MKFNKKFNQLLLLLITLISCTCFASQAKTNDKSPVLTESLAEEEKIRWFEVEIIVYKPTHKKGFAKESWDKKLIFQQADQQVDFLQPYYLSPEQVLPGSNNLDETMAANLDAAQDSESLALLTPTITNTTTQTADGQPVDKAIKNPSDNSIVDIHSLDEEAQLLNQFNQPIEEKPFVPLAKELLQLTNEVSSLNRHPDYRVLTHLGWRQPMLGKSQATRVRIAGGQDYSQEYDYQGNKLMSAPLSETPEVSETSGQTLEGTFDASTEVTFETHSILAKNSIDNDESLAVQPFPQIQQLVPTLWVPELDGYIKIYLNRFLHIRTNLFLRVPDKEEIEAVDLDVYNPEMLSSFSASDAPDNPETNNSDASFTETNTANQFKVAEEFVLTDPSISTNDNTTQQIDENTSLLNEQNNQLLINKKEHQFSWEIGDDFLQTESDKLYVERLFNYSVKQSRKVRSGELHFFDHPLMGILIIIRPYELPAEPADNFSPKI